MSVRIPEGSTNYHMAFMIGRVRYSRTTGTGDRREADKMEREWKAEIRASAARHPLAGMKDCTFDQAAELYWEEQGENTRDWRSLETEIERVIALVGAETMCSAINLAMERRIRAALRKGERPPGIGNRGRPLKAGNRYNTRSINNTLDLISRILTHTEGSLETVFPFKPRGKRRGENGKSREIERPRYRYMSTMELDAFRKVSEPRLLDMVEFDLETGMRREALCDAKWKDIDWNKDTITFNLKAEGQEPVMHEVDLSDEALKMLYRLKLDHPHPEFIFRLPAKKDYWDGEKHIKVGDLIPVDPELLYRRFKKTCKAAVIDGMNIHDLRRTAARRIYDDFDIEAARAFLGHSDYRQTQDYLGLKANDLKPILRWRSKRAKAERAEIERAAKSVGRKSSLRARALRAVLAERDAVIEKRKSAGRGR